MDSPLGRVAGRSGGILARLWRQDQEKFEGRLEQVLVGPTAYAEIKLAAFDLGPEGCYIDDELTENMMALICGVYSRSNGRWFMFVLLLIPQLKPSIACVSSNATRSAFQVHYPSDTG